MIRYLNSLWCMWFWGHHWYDYTPPIESSITIKYKDGRHYSYYHYTCKRCGTTCEDRYE